MISVAEARALLAAERVGPRRETVPFSAALGRVLATPFCAPFAQPRDDNSAMDGYAVRAADVAAVTAASPLRLRVVGVSAAGAPTDARVEPGTCTQVMTGALIPAGADAVIPVELTGGFSTEEAELLGAVAAGANIRRRGEEVPQGVTLIDAPTLIGPAELSTLVTYGAATVEVAVRPKVALFSTGDELREPGEALGPGDVYNSNLHLLAAIARAAGAEVRHGQLVRDDAASLRSFLGAALADCEVVCASGGVSMGRFDLVRGTLAELGAEELFWQVAQKPGKPLSVSRTSAGLFFGLPGNPVSTLTTFLVYVLPHLRRLLGLGELPSWPVPLAAPFRRERAKHRFLLGRLRQTAQGLVVEPSGRAGSHMSSASLGANVLLEAGPGDEALSVGTPVTVTPLPWAGLETLFSEATP